MKAENIFLLIAVGVILYQYSKQQDGGTIHWIDCTDPLADPVMCAILEEQQGA